MPEFEVRRDGVKRSRRYSTLGALTALLLVLMLASPVQQAQASEPTDQENVPTTGGHGAVSRNGPVCDGLVDCQPLDKIQLPASFAFKGVPLATASATGETCWRFDRTWGVVNRFGSTLYRFGFLAEWCGVPGQVTRIRTFQCFGNPNSVFIYNGCRTTSSPAGATTVAVRHDWDFRCCFNSTFTLSYTPEVDFTVHGGGRIHGTVRGW